MRIRNGNPGITSVSLSIISLNDVAEILLEDSTISDNEEKDYSFSDTKAARNLVLNLIFKLGSDGEWSGLQYIEFLTEDTTEEFLIKHDKSGFYLSASPKDNMLFVHPYTCRTKNHTLWSCRNGQLRSSNGKILRFMDKEAYTDAMRNGVTSPEGSVSLIPTFRPEGQKRSTIVDFSDNDNSGKDNFLAFTVEGQKYYLRPQKFPDHSNLKTVMGSEEYFKIEIAKPGLSLMSHKHSDDDFILEKRFAYKEDETECYEFPTSNKGQCNSKGCTYSEGTDLCEYLSGYPADGTDVTANQNLVLIMLF